MIMSVVLDSEHNHLTFFVLFELKNESTTPFALKANNIITPEEKTLIHLHWVTFYFAVNSGKEKWFWPFISYRTQLYEILANEFLD